MTHLTEAVGGYFIARQPRKDSQHTLDAYRNDLDKVSALIATQTGIPIEALTVDALTLPVMRAAFAAYAKPREKSTIRRCWSTWHGFFNYLVTEGLLDGNPMAGVARPNAPRRNPKAFDEDATDRITEAIINAPTEPGGGAGRDPWPERDLAIIFTLLVTGIRRQELLDLSIGSITGPAAQRRIRVLGKGDAERTIPIEPGLEDVINAYLATRRIRFPSHATKRRLPENPQPIDHYPTTAPLFVDRNGEPLQRGALAYLVQTVYRRAGVESVRQRGALVHALRHTFATRLAENPEVNVAQLMDLLGHRSMSTTQLYIKATGRGVREAVSLNPAYRRLNKQAATAAGAAEAD